MNLFGMMQVSASALTAERVRAQVSAVNMANAESTRGVDGEPYKRQIAELQTVDGGSSFQSHLFSSTGTTAATGGVEVAEVTQSQAPALRRYDPSHPDADKDGYVSFPDINPLTEMVDLAGATRAYGMNATAVQAEKQMIAASLEILK